MASQERTRHLQRLPWRLWGLIVAFLLLASWAAFAAEAPTRLTAEDARWLNRITYGLDAATVERYRQLGRKRFLEEQLKPSGLILPADVREVLDAQSQARKPLVEMLMDVDAENKRIQSLTDEEAKQLARQAQNQAANQMASEAARRHLLRALWSPAQLQEQMTWFWLNHFSVFQGKGNLRWTVGDYEERAIRPHALGRFRDLVMATLTHPAMLVYLDNAQSAGGKVNENYARELLELHTLGVDGGYTQQDVQELARVLTGVGVNVGKPRKVRPEWQALYRQEGAFEFHPGRHDFGDKVLLGTRIQGAGFAEVERAVDLLVTHSSTARFVSRKLATYWLGGPPPPALVDQLAREFTRTHGDIPSVLRVLLSSKTFTDSLGNGFRDPMHYVMSTLRFAYDGKHPLNMKPVANWLNALGEPLYGHGTPDGYALTMQAWSSPGQLAKRFEIARAIGNGSAGLFDGDDGKPGPVTGFPQLSSRLYFEVVEPLLSPATRKALDHAASQQEWNTFLLASPESMAR
ncbi:DUF1800 domain-containing protein [Geothrix sp. PMB-07]|uniref:DUF1800 domain-containing protein n=1 Tax=Geothrix sp. PMB-07 TaxID=3068640 RepID=UPI002741E72D|nr:DUF1800 domain-containing protein [Geothrix sp. PMB-07]WLT31903.1 DUF1800 domain-containing protein [Geothrix sp. PMB-07]